MFGMFVRGAAGLCAVGALRSGSIDATVNFPETLGTASAGSFGVKV